ncbi:hypothetical protein SAMN04487886_10432 [Clostridium sp. DSM 8431]|uniref:YtxH domain-containing protein n=1 Tax=Clostridium sp. DSM 8431 TaxID=1761781 RepID=UPI0008E96CFA|nr:YtxH domain-containing protein [Clostridium sp. DSM 8431]SFU50554.1 hypothetical protein SAMN04487886_10432 [Clostridium sp. DSM 8431]
MSKYLNGMMTGVMVGAAVGMTVMPQLDRRTQRMVKRAGRKIIDLAENSYENRR